MILVNRNFGNPALSQAISDMFKPTSDVDMNLEWINHTNTLATDSSLVSSLNSVLYSVNSGSGGSTTATATRNLFKATQTPNNFFIVTEKFITVLDKVYTKIWNESFTENGIYVATNLATLYSGFVNDTSLAENSKTIKGQINPTTYNTAVNFMLFKKFVDRCITAGVLDEADRLDYQDQISLSNLNKTNLSTQIDLDNKLITFTSVNPVDVAPDINSLEGNYLNNKKLFLMMTPYLTNESIIKLTETIASLASTTSQFVGTKQEPFINYVFTEDTYSGAGPGPEYIAPVRRPLAFFKPKTPESKYGRSLPLATHLIWRIGTQADKDLAEIEGTEVPEIIFDHLNRISHIDSLKLEIKYDNLQF